MHATKVEDTIPAAVNEIENVFISRKILYSFLVFLFLALEVPIEVVNFPSVKKVTVLLLQISVYFTFSLLYQEL